MGTETRVLLMVGSVLFMAACLVVLAWIEQTGRK